MQSSVNQKESRTFFGHPYPLGSLFFTEMWERFSFYGIRPLLILFMAATVYDGGMGLARENASAIVGIFAGTMYLAALPGGWLADNWLGQQKAVWYGSILTVDCALCRDGRQPVLYRPDVYRARFWPVQDLYLGHGGDAV